MPAFSTREDVQHALKTPLCVPIHARQPYTPRSLFKTATDDAKPRTRDERQREINQPSLVEPKPPHPFYESQLVNSRGTLGLGYEFENSQFP